MDRKALIRAYKETPRPMGAYRVRNTVSGKTLVGVYRNLDAILNRHRAQLRLGVHPVRQLQEDWNALGEDAFAFEVLEVLKPSDQPDYDPTSDLRLLEEIWLDQLEPFGEKGYNVRGKN